RPSDVPTDVLRSVEPGGDEEATGVRGRAIEYCAALRAVDIGATECTQLADDRDAWIDDTRQERKHAGAHEPAARKRTRHRHLLERVSRTRCRLRLWRMSSGVLNGW